MQKDWICHTISAGAEQDYVLGRLHPLDKDTVELHAKFADAILSVEKELKLTEVFGSSGTSASTGGLTSAPSTHGGSTSAAAAAAPVASSSSASFDDLEFCRQLDSFARKQGELLDQLMQKLHPQEPVINMIPELRQLLRAALDGVNDNLHSATSLLMQQRSNTGAVLFGSGGVSLCPENFLAFIPSNLRPLVFDVMQKSAMEERKLIIKVGLC